MNKAQTRPMRSLVIGLAAAGALLAAVTGQIGAHAQAIAAHNSNAPVNTAADRIELQDRQNRVLLSGNVDITQADLQLQAARTLVNYSNNGSLQIQRITATGGVRVTRGNEVASGDVAVYDFNKRIITMAGNVKLQRGTDTLSGGRLVIDLQSGLSSVDGSAAAPGVMAQSGGRVTGTFTVPKN